MGTANATVQVGHHKMIIPGTVLVLSLVVLWNMGRISQEDCAQLMQWLVGGLLCIYLFWFVNQAVASYREAALRKSQLEQHYKSQVALQRLAEICAMTSRPFTLELQGRGRCTSAALLDLQSLKELVLEDYREPEWMEHAYTNTANTASNTP